jgi:hypothetical protein
VTAPRFIVGFVLGVGALAAVAWGVASVRARLLPGWSGAPARLVEAVLALALAVGVAQMLGIVGAFALVPLAAGWAGAGAGTALVARRLPPGGASAAPTTAPEPPWARPLSILIGALVASEWIARSIPALQRGIATPDSLWYHMPIAVRFVQDRSITALHFYETEPGISFYPATSELVHAIGIVLLDGDVLSTVLNVGWVGLALLAGWCIGRPRGLGLASLIGVAVVVGSPVMVGTQPAGAYNDAAGLALGLATAALLATGGLRPAPVAFAGMAAGLAAGVKVTMLAPVAALTLGVIALTPGGERRRMALAWLVPLVALGGFWYARNLVQAGNPLPWLDLPLLSSPPTPEADRIGQTVAHYLTDRGVWDRSFLPGLDLAFGPLWWVVLGLAALGTATALLFGAGVPRMLAAVAAATAVAYLLTPQTAGGPEGEPRLFFFNLRFLTPALALGLALLALAPPLVRGWRRWAVLGALALLLLVNESQLTVRPNSPREIAAAAALIGAAATIVGLRRLRVPRAAALTGAAGLLAVVAAAGWLVQRGYLGDRYAPESSVTPRTMAWLRSAGDERIAIASLTAHYPFYGHRLSNRVEFVGVRGPGGAFAPVRDCRTWRQALDRGGYRYVVFGIGPTGAPPPEERWTRSAAAASPTIREAPLFAVYRLDGPLGTSGCA